MATASGRWGALASMARAVQAATRPGSASLAERANAVPRLVSATLSGRYAGTSRVRLALLIGGVAYVVSPVDLLPEGLLAGIGLADDAVVLSWVAATLVNETEQFLEWEKTAGRTVPGRVVS